MNVNPAFGLHLQQVVGWRLSVAYVKRHRVYLIRTDVVPIVRNRQATYRARTHVAVDVVDASPTTGARIAGALVNGLLASIAVEASNAQALVRIDVVHTCGTVQARVCKNGTYYPTREQQRIFSVVVRVNGLETWLGHSCTNRIRARERHLEIQHSSILS